MSTKTKLVSMSAVLCAAAFSFSPSTQAGTWAGFHRVDTNASRVSPGSGASSRGPVTSPNTSGVSANRHGADDPANHDINDDRGGNQAGDDRGRHRRRGHGG